MGSFRQFAEQEEEGSLNLDLSLKCALSIQARALSHPIFGLIHAERSNRAGNHNRLEPEVQPSTRRQNRANLAQEADQSEC